MYEIFERELEKLGVVRAALEDFKVKELAEVLASVINNLEDWEYEQLTKTDTDDWGKPHGD